LVLIFHDKLAMVFSSSEAVIRAVDSISILLALTILLNGIQPVLSGKPDFQNSTNGVGL
jgi:MATE family multidrug resistance protein